MLHCQTEGPAPGAPGLDLPLVLYPEEGTNKYGDSHVVWFSPESRPCDFVQPSSMHNLQSEFNYRLFKTTPRAASTSFLPILYSLFLSANEK